MFFPEKLKKGDSIGLVCPSSPVFPKWAEQCIDVFTSMGYKVKCADNVSMQYAGFCAGSAEIRARNLEKMFSDDEIKAIFCIRGGDGIGQVLNILDENIIRSNPKIFVGYSDITALHQFINKRCGFVTFHGPMAYSNFVAKPDEASIKSLFDCINGEYDYYLPSDDICPVCTLKDGKASGEITGGNLSLISASIGTPYEIDTDGKIIFIEDCEEPLYRMERYADHLKNAGKFDNCAGVILGQFTDVKNDYDSKYGYLELFADVLKEKDFPIMYNIQSGHGSPMFTIPLGAVCHMDTEEKSIRFEIKRK